MRMNLEQISEGLVNETITNFDAYCQLRKLSDTITELMKQIKPKAVNELKERGGTFEDDTLKVLLQNSAGRWTFDQIPEWAKLKEEMKQIEQNGKDAFKAWEKGKTITDEEGVVVQPAQYIGGEETFIFKFKK